MKKKEEKKVAKKSNFNRLPISPPKGWTQPDRLPDYRFRMIPR